jgi:hypothetical protein
VISSGHLSNEGFHDGSQVFGTWLAIRCLRYVYKTGFTAPLGYPFFNNCSLQCRDTTYELDGLKCTVESCQTTIALHRGLGELPEK